MAGPVLPPVPGQRHRDTFHADVASGVLLGGHRRRGRRTVAAYRPQTIPKDVPLGAEVGGGAIDRFQEHQQIRLLLRSQLCLNRGRRRKPRSTRPQPVQREDLLEGLGLAAV